MRSESCPLVGLADAWPKSSCEEHLLVPAVYDRLVNEDERAVREFYDRFNAGDVEGAADQYAEECEWDFPAFSSVCRTRAEVLDVCRSWKTAFPDRSLSRLLRPSQHVRTARVDAPRHRLSAEPNQGSVAAAGALARSVRGHALPGHGMTSSSGHCDFQRAVLTS
jgi:SnoaL-like domain